LSQSSFIQFVSAHKKVSEGPVRSLVVETVVQYEDTTRRLSEQQATSLMAVHENLADHACKMKGIKRFGEAILQASIPHVLEHLTIDLMVEEYGYRIAGTTTWQSRDDGLALIRFNLQNTPLSEPESLRLQCEQTLLAAISELNALLTDN
jgi:hypothetical protein